MTEQELVGQLRRKAVTCKTGLLLLPRSRLGTEPNLAATNGMDAVDLAQVFVSKQSGDSDFVGITLQRLWKELDGIADSPDGSDCVLIYNVDLLLARLDSPDRQGLWRHLRQNPPHKRRAIVLLMPAEAAALLPSDNELTTWRRFRKVAEAQDN